MNSQVVAIQSALALLGLWFFLCYFWRDYRIDAFRDHVFSIRDRLFLYAANGGVSFDDPAYTMLRYRINVILRYAHAFTFFRVFVVALRRSPGKSPDILRWEKALEALPSMAAREKLQEFNVTLVIAILQLVVYRSLFLYVVVRPIMPFIPTRKVIIRNPNVVSSVEQLESETLEEEARSQAHDDVPVVA